MKQSEQIANLKVEVNDKDIEIKRLKALIEELEMKLQCMNETNTKLQKRIEELLKEGNWNYPERVKSKKQPYLKSSNKPKRLKTPQSIQTSETTGRKFKPSKIKNFSPERDRSVDSGNAQIQQEHLEYADIRIDIPSPKQLPPEVDHEETQRRLQLLEHER